VEKCLDRFIFGGRSLYDTMYQFGKQPCFRNELLFEICDSFLNTPGLKQVNEMHHVFDNLMPSMGPEKVKLSNKARSIDELLHVCL